MNSQANSSDRAVLLTVGRTRVGKGEFISTANRLLHGRGLPHIVSRRKVSHTKKTHGYPMRLADEDIRMVDTVGFDDSSGTDIPETTLLRFLADTGKADFYPPLVILQTLSALEKDVLKKTSAVFSEVVVALRVEDASEIEEAQNDIANECRVTPIRVFPIQTFVRDALDGGRSRQLYDSDVSAILDFYRTLTASRKKLDFSSELFKGEFERRPSRPETKSEVVKVRSNEKRLERKTIEVPKKKTLVNGGHFERTADCAKVKRLTAGADVCHAGAAGCGVGGAALSATIAAMPEVAAMSAMVPPVAIALLGASAGLFIAGACLKDEADFCEQGRKWVVDKKEEIVYVTKNEVVNVKYIITQKFRRTSEREVHEVWKVLAGEIEIFVEYAYGPWKVLSDELLDHFETEMPAYLPEDKLPKGLSKGERVH